MSGMTALAPLDWVLLTVLLLSCLIGMWRGLVYEALILTGWVLAFLASRWFGPQAGAWLPLGGSAPGGLRAGLGYTLVFIVVAFTWGMVAWRMRRAVQVMGLRPVDHMLGAAFGAARAIAVLLVAAALVDLTPLGQESWWRASIGVHWLETGLRQLHPYLPALPKLPELPKLPDLPSQARRYLPD